MSKHTAHDAEQTFEQMLHRSLSEIQKPGQVPSGRWLLNCVFTGTRGNENYKGGDDFYGTYNFTFTPLRVVNEDSVTNMELVEAGAWRGAKIDYTIFRRDDSDDFKARELIETLGISSEGRDLVEGIKLARGRQLIADVKPFPTKDRDGNPVMKHKLSNLQAA